MADRIIHFQDYLNEEVNKVKGVYYPVRASFLRRKLCRTAPCRKLHPNPEDEFCFPDIGPNYGIISKYEEQYRQNVQFKSGLEEGGILEPIMVQKAKPDGYLILNGHHRWAAAMRSGIDRVKIEIVNLTQLSDIREMLEHSQSDRRMTLDLDEVVFRPDDASCVEKPLRFPLNRIYKERVRKGIPALLHALNERDCDIWVYTSKYYSMEYIRAFFLHMNVRLTGIVTGTAQKGPRAAKTAAEMKKMIEKKYAVTIYIDNDMIILTTGGAKEAAEYRLSGNPETWSREAMEILGKLNAKR
jgi:hypothetical protein